MLKDGQKRLAESTGTETPEATASAANAPKLNPLDPPPKPPAAGAAF
jgi:hypothetical protein